MGERWEERVRERVESLRSLGRFRGWHVLRPTRENRPVNLPVRQEVVDDRLLEALCPPLLVLLLHNGTATRLRAELQPAHHRGSHLQQAVGDAPPQHVRLVAPVQRKQAVRVRHTGLQRRRRLEVVAHSLRRLSLSRAVLRGSGDHHSRCALCKQVLTHHLEAAVLRVVDDEQHPVSRHLVAAAVPLRHLVQQLDHATRVLPGRDHRAGAGADEGQRPLALLAPLPSAERRPRHQRRQQAPPPHAVLPEHRAERQREVDGREQHLRVRVRLREERAERVALEGARKARHPHARLARRSLCPGLFRTGTHARLLRRRGGGGGGGPVGRRGGGGGVPRHAVVGQQPALHDVVHVCRDLRLHAGIHRGRRRRRGRRRAGDGLRRHPPLGQREGVGEGDGHVDDGAEQARRLDHLRQQANRVALHHKHEPAVHEVAELHGLDSAAAVRRKVGGPPLEQVLRDARARRLHVAHDVQKDALRDGDDGLRHPRGREGVQGLRTPTVSDDEVVVRRRRLRRVRDELDAGEAACPQGTHATLLHKAAAPPPRRVQHVAGQRAELAPLAARRLRHRATLVPRHEDELEEHREVLPREPEPLQVRPPRVRVPLDLRVAARRDRRHRHLLRRDGRRDGRVGRSPAEVLRQHERVVGDDLVQGDVGQVGGHPRGLLRVVVRAPTPLHHQQRLLRHLLQDASEQALAGPQLHQARHALRVVRQLAHDRLQLRLVHVPLACRVPRRRPLDRAGVAARAAAQGAASDAGAELVEADAGSLNAGSEGRDGCAVDGDVLVALLPAALAAGGGSGGGTFGSSGAVGGGGCRGGGRRCRGGGRHFFLLPHSLSLPPFLYTVSLFSQ
eukprot:Rhum_TRINITY_DN8249_c0_g1::Rhum_TRINITY_DN8249_c0_g1_i1::g.26826::m.26826